VSNYTLLGPSGIAPTAERALNRLGEQLAERC
jgi:hypothetical protein